MDFKDYEHKRAKKIVQNQGPELDWVEVYGVNTEDFSVRYKENGKKETESSSNE